MPARKITRFAAADQGRKDASLTVIGAFERDG
jgi:hypothetical protein